jgi:hypothetical protein
MKKKACFIGTSEAIIGTSEAIRHCSPSRKEKAAGILLPRILLRQKVWYHQ